MLGLQMQSKTTKRAEAHSDRCRVRIEECLRITPQGAEILDQRSEVINEARATAAAPAPKLAVSTSHELREYPNEPDPNPKKNNS